MLLDLIFIVILILAVIRGYRKGLIAGIFSFIAIIIGLAAAIKLSTVVAGYIDESVRVSREWLPVISFVIVFIIVVLLIRWGANLMQRAIELAMLGWANRLGGVVFYVAVYTITFSVLMFYAEQIKLIQPSTIEKSVTYSFFQPWGPKAIDSLGSVFPFFKGMFTELEKFFDHVAQKIS